MDRSPLDLYKPDFWCVLAVAVLVLVPIVSPLLRKWAWAAINVAFLGLLLGMPDRLRMSELLERYQFGDAVRLVAGCDLVLVCAAVGVVWAVLQTIQWRRLGPLPVIAGGLVLLGLFAIHKVPAADLYSSEGATELLDAVGLSSNHVQPLKSLLMAIGFSYVALRLVEVLRTTYEGRHPAPDLPSTINYLLPFHMLAAGPIQAYSDFVAQPAVSPPITASGALGGVERIAHGLFKKYVLATVVDRMFLTGFRAPLPYMALETMLFYLWVYLDFSAYSDITVGAGRLMGIATPENFNRPYVARNLIDFWDRWHMSLSRFIFRNVFIPVQLNLLRRTGPQRALWCSAVAFSVSFLLCGLWHELNVRWLLWGALHAAGLVTVNCYRAWLQKRLSREALNRYREHRGIRLAAIALTQAFAAATLLVATWPRD
ncbi:MAG TPA: MBOAT family O-acyltransferase [Pirellulales bacterium]|nr:MBOAT family O-acyltransferase [Pirellulales bacterium]